jgi:hypothetical protein
VEEIKGKESEWKKRGGREQVEGRRDTRRERRKDDAQLLPNKVHLFAFSPQLGHTLPSTDPKRAWS